MLLWNWLLKCDYWNSEFRIPLLLLIVVPLFIHLHDYLYPSSSVCSPLDGSTTTLMEIGSAEKLGFKACTSAAVKIHPLW